jgi:hypothetical protein
LRLQRNESVAHLSSAEQPRIGSVAVRHVAERATPILAGPGGRHVQL